MGPIICLSDKFPGDLDAADLGTTQRTTTLVPPVFPPGGQAET